MTVRVHLVAASILAAAAASFGCSSDKFVEAGVGQSGGSGALHVAMDWPERADLDPKRDARASSIHVTVRDLDAADRVYEQDVTGFPNRLDLDEVPWGAHVEIAVQVKSGVDGQVIGYGMRRAALPSEGDVTLFVRKRLIYVGDSDGTGDLGAYSEGLRAFDLATPGEVEPVTDPTLIEQIPGVDHPVGLHVTDAGDRVVLAGVAAGTQRGIVQVTSTSTHQHLADIELPSAPATMVSIGDGTRALVALEDGPAAIFLVDLNAGSATPLPIPDAVGGGFRGADAVVTSDGSRAYVVGEETSGTTPAPRLLAIDLTASPPTVQPHAVGLETPTGVRVDATGAHVYVGGYTSGTPVVQGSVELWSTASFMREDVVQLPAGGTQANTLVLHPDGAHLYVTSVPQYPPSGPCCSSQYVIDLRDKSVSTIGDDAIVSAVRTPDGRAIGGESYWANDGNGDLAYVTDPTGPVRIHLETYTGNAVAVAVPFGQRL